MTDKKKIKEEIERRRKQLPKETEHKGLMAVYGGIAYELTELLQFIDSLPEEPSVKGITWEDVNTLESLIYQVHNEYPSIGEKSFGLEVLERFQDCQDSIEEPANEDLEEEIENYTKDSLAIKFPTTDKEQIKADIRYIARHFAEWQKQKDQETIELAEDHAMLAGMNKMKEEMMEDAVEGTVKYEIGSAEIPQCDRRYQVLSDPTPITNAKLGDKVKVLILKTEQQ